MASALNSFEGRPRRGLGVLLCLALCAAAWPRPVAGADAESDPAAIVSQRIELSKKQLYLPGISAAERTPWAVSLFLERHPDAERALLEALKPGAPISVRAAVCAAISDEQLVSRPPDAFDNPTFDCLLDGDSNLRESAAGAIGRLASRPGSRLWDRLRAKPAEPDITVELRIAVLRAVGYVHTRAAFDLLLEALTGADEVVAAVIVEGLQRITARTDLTQPRQWRAAARTFASMTDEEFFAQARRLRVKRLRELEQMQEQLEKDLTSSEAARYELRPADQRAAFLIERLKHAQPCLRVWAAGKITTLDEKEITEAMVPPLLVGLTQPEHPRVRTACATALPFVEARLTRPAGAAAPGRSALRAALDQEIHAEVSASIVSALAKYRNPDDIPIAGRRLYDPREQVAEAAAAAFGELAVPGANGTDARAALYFNQLLELTEAGEAPSRSESVRRTALRSAVRVMPEARVGPRLSALLEDGLAGVREEAVLGISQRPGVLTSISPLLRRLGDPSRRVRTAALQAVGTVARDSQIEPAVRALSERLTSEKDVEVARNVVLSIAAVIGKLPVAEQLAHAEKFGRSDAAHKRAAAAVRQKLLEPAAGIKDEDTRRACLAALADLLRELGDLTDAAGRYRQLATLLRTKDADASARAAMTAFHCSASTKQYKDAWDWAGEYAGRAAEPTQSRLLVQMLDQLRALTAADQETTVLECLAAVPEAPWTKGQAFGPEVFRVRSEAESRRRRRVQEETAKMIAAYLTGIDAERKIAVTALAAQGPSGLVAAVRRLDAELKSGSPRPADEIRLVQLCTELMAARADRPFNTALYPSNGPLAARKDTVAAWLKSLGAPPG
jgi:hypothetical protein